MPALPKETSRRSEHGWEGVGVGVEVEVEVEVVIIRLSIPPSQLPKCACSNPNQMAQHAATPFVTYQHGPPWIQRKTCPCHGEWTICRRECKTLPISSAPIRYQSKLFIPLRLPSPISHLPFLISRSLSNCAGFHSTSLSLTLFLTITIFFSFIFQIHFGQYRGPIPGLIDHRSATSSTTLFGLGTSETLPQE